MRHPWWLSLLCLAAGLAPLSAADAPITWKKTVLDKVFRSEGVAVADVNKDGKIDVLNGEAWYEAPDWKRHEIRKLGDYGDGLRGYSNSFACWTDDFNKDGWPDVIVIGFPGAPCHWFENPQGKSVHWKQHEITHSACNETPQYVDLFGNGKRVLVMGWQPKGKATEGQMAWFAPGSDPTQPWEMHSISGPSQSPRYVLTEAGLKGLEADKVPAEVVARLGEIKGKEFKSDKELLDAAAKLMGADAFKAHQNKVRARGAVGGKEVPGTQRFSHGLGVTDVNGDGRLDVVCTGGWWEQPAPAKQGNSPWPFHAGNLGPACADMYALDLDGDGKNDIVSSSAHKFGIWSYHPTEGKNSNWLQKTLFPELVSETHAMNLADINGDGVPDLVTGKRWWSHGRAEPGADKASMVYWLEGKKGKDGVISFTPREIDNDSGIGTQFVVADINGDKLLDVITSNKKGTFVIEQVRAQK